MTSIIFFRFHLALMLMLTAVICFVAPVFMSDSAGHEDPFDKDEGEDRADEDEGDKVGICLLIAICLWEDVHHCISHQSPAAQGV